VLARFGSCHDVRLLQLDAAVMDTLGGRCAAGDFMVHFFLPNRCQSLFAGDWQPVEFFEHPSRRCIAVIASLPVQVLPLLQRLNSLSTVFLAAPCVALLSSPHSFYLWGSNEKSGITRDPRIRRRAGLGARFEHRILDGLALATEAVGVRFERLDSGVASG
jgi:hypothetical protein